MPTSCHPGYPLQSQPPIPMLLICCPIQAKSKPVAGLIEAFMHPCARLRPRDAQSDKQSMTPATADEGFYFERHKYSHRGCGGEPA